MVLICLTCLVLSNSCAQLSPASIVGNAPNNMKLCQALETIGPGEVMPITVSGMYAIGAEIQELFDPDQPECALDVQPATWIEFAPEVDRSKLVRILETAGRAKVTFAGELYGPGVVKPDDSSLPFAAALAGRLAGRRYGHLNLYRTKLVVHSVIDVTAASKGDPWEWTPRDDDAERLSEAPQRLDFPKYPETARKLGVTGEVEVLVVVEDGQVVSSEVESGDRLLAREAVATIKTWAFAPGTAAVFKTTFVYELEWRAAKDQVERVELDLPLLVKVKGARSGW